MKYFIISNNRIIAACTEPFDTPDLLIQVDESFDETRLEDYEFDPVTQQVQAIPEPEPEPYTPAVAWELIKQIRDRKTQQGGYLAGGKWFHSDTFSRTQQIGLTIMGTNIPAGLMWKTMSGEFVEMTPTLAQQIFTAAGQQDAALFAYAEQLKAQVEAAQDPASINLESSWPSTFNNI